MRDFHTLCVPVIPSCCCTLLTRSFALMREPQHRCSGFQWSRAPAALGMWKKLWMKPGRGVLRSLKNVLAETNSLGTRVRCSVWRSTTRRCSSNRRVGLLTPACTSDELSCSAHPTRSVSGLLRPYFALGVCTYVIYPLCVPPFFGLGPTPEPACLQPCAALVTLRPKFRGGRFVAQLALQRSPSRQRGFLSSTRR